jgi:hypothetical protein
VAWLANRSWPEHDVKTLSEEKSRNQGEVPVTTPTTRTAARTGILAALVLAVGLLATPPVAAQPSAAPAPPGTVTLVPTAASTASATSRPPNGTILYSRIRGGLGTLTIKNGLSKDGVVALVLGRSKAISVYVWAGSSTTVRNIKDGTYTIYFATGSLFSVSKGRFTRGATYWRFNNRPRFVPRRTTPSRS